MSTAITFLIIQHKPIKFITTDEVVNKYGIAAELSYSSFFQSPLVNIDAEDADISVPVVFDSVYDEFIDKYLYTNGFQNALTEYGDYADPPVLQKMRLEKQVQIY